MPRQDKRVAILVAGMHRSGTSFVTRLLSFVGCDLPATLMRPHPDNNEAGFWESQPIADLNDEALASAGSAWNDWRAFDSDWYGSPVAGQFRERAQAVLREQFGDSRLFVLKDSRICRLMPFWIEAIRAIGAEPLVISPIRNPLDVAASLQARDEIDPSTGYLIWLRHVLDAEKASRSLGRAYVRYEILLSEVHATMDMLGDTLGISWPRRISVDAQMKIDEFVLPALQHHRTDDAKLLKNPRLSRWIVSSFEILDRWCRGETNEKDLSRLAQVRSAFDAATPAFSRVLAASERRISRRDVQIRRTLADHDARIEALGRSVAERDTRIEGLNQSIAARDDRIKTLGRSVAERNAQIEALGRSVAERDSHIEALGRSVAERDTRIEALGRSVAERDTQIEALGRSVAERDTRIEALGRSVAERDTQIEALGRSVAERDSQVEALGQSVAERDTRIEALNQSAAERDAQIGALNQAIAERDDRIKTLGRSVAERDLRIEGLNQSIAEHDDRIKTLGRSVAERDIRIEGLNQSIAARDTRIEALGRVHAEYDSQIGALHQSVAERDRRIEELNQKTAAERDERIAELLRMVEDRDGQIRVIRQALDKHDHDLAKLYASNSWRMTAPLRILRQVPRTLVDTSHAGLSRTALKIYRQAPLPPTTKQHLRKLVVGFAPWLIRNLASNRSKTSSLEYYAVSRPELAESIIAAKKRDSRFPIVFDPSFYLDSNKDVKDAGVDPLEHYLGWGAIEGRMPLGDIHPDKLHPLVQSIHRFDMSADETTTDIDTDFYRMANPDLAHLDDEAMREHYENHGRCEKRADSMRTLVNSWGGEPREVPLDFDPEEYADLYAWELYPFGKSPLPLLNHYMEYGRWLGKPYSRLAFRVSSQTSRDGSSEKSPADPLSANSPQLCILAHVYYTELWNELSDYICNLPEGMFALYVNLVDTTFSHELLSRIRDRFPFSRIYISENRGRDIGGFLRLLENIHIDDYRIYGLIHTKKSTHLPEHGGRIWRERLLTSLMETKECATENISLMLADDSIGLLAAESCRHQDISKNNEKYNQLLDRLNIGAGARNVEYVTGTMGFLRADVLRRVFEGLRNLPFENGNGKSMDFHRDGQWEHAAERVIGNVVRDMGYRFEWR